MSNWDDWWESWKRHERRWSATDEPRFFFRGLDRWWAAKRRLRWRAYGRQVKP